jgi:hypothetical protein
MIEIRIPKDINEYKEKIFLGLTMRQVLSLVAIVVINVPAYMLLSPVIGMDGAGWVIMINAVPIGAFGFVKVAGMPIEKFAFLFIMMNFVYPQNRIYASENIYEELANIVEKEKFDLKRDEFEVRLKAEKDRLQQEERLRRSGKK